MKMNIIHFTGKFSLNANKNEINMIDGFRCFHMISVFSFSIFIYI